MNIIPYVAINKDFHGKPSDPPRYSDQIVQDLIFEARQHQERKPLLALYVDPRNIGAIKVYKRHGFVNYQTKIDEEDGIEYQGMVLALASAN